MAAYLPIELQRNGSFGCTLKFTDTAGDPLDLDGAAFYCRAKSDAGAGAVLATATVELIDAETGEVGLEWDGAAFVNVPGALERVELAYDLIASQDGARMVLLRGPLILLPGVS